MKNAYILHGICDQEEFCSQDYPSPSNSHWIPWLQKQLLLKGYNCQTPDFPKPYNPTYKTWKNLFECYPLDKETILVGHSAGCGFFLRWLSENTQSIKKLVLVAPWLDPHKIHGDFLDCRLNADLIGRVDEIHVFYSKDEDVVGVKETVDLVMKTYSEAVLHELNGMGHFCLDDMGTEQFPELLDVVG